MLGPRDKTTDAPRAAGARAKPNRPRRLSAEAQRQRILGISADVFRERGFAGAAMSEVARRLGSSKETLYRHFPSKRELFAAVVQEGARSHAHSIFTELSTTHDLVYDLRRFGRAYLTLITSPEILAMRRMVIAEGDRSDIGRIYFEYGQKAGWTLVADRLAKAMAQGKLRRAEPWTAAMHFQALCESGPYALRLQGLVREDLSFLELTDAVDDAVDAFLRAYAAGAAAPSSRATFSAL